MKTPKTLFIPAKSKSVVNKSKIAEISGKLPKKLAIVYSIQFKEIAKDIKEILSEQENHEILSFKQVLGCSKPDFPKQIQAVLLISTGKFHALSMAYSMSNSEKNSSVPIYILDKNQLIKITGKDMEKFKQRQKATYVNFLNSKTVGILASTKPGQNRLKKALNLKKKLGQKSKNPYLFICNNISTLEFDNFPNIDSWINTACPRLDMESNAVINSSELESYLKA
ncbi:hypothetical protein GF378_00290 [Candidatus Pacearchaeota archaeon]|nr:hypothetical protein [Candidatus Pacearchaeota archaeon]